MLILRSISGRKAGALLVAVVAVAGFAASAIRIPYRIAAKAVFVPAREYTLERTTGGHLVSSFRDNVRNAIDSYGVTQFARGDVVEFVLADSIADRAHVDEGDTLGWIVSNDENRKLLELQGELRVLEARLQDLETGRKPEEVTRAKEQWDLARQKLEIQKSLTERMRRLQGESLVSEQDYEVAANQLRVREIAVDVARADYLATRSGEKPESIELIRTRIGAVRDQIDQVEEKIGRFTLVSPASGEVILPRGGAESQTLLSIADTSRSVAIVPIRAEERSRLRVGQAVFYDGRRGRLDSIGGEVSLIDRHQAIQVTAVWPSDPEILPGSIRDVTVACEPVTLIEYALRAMGRGRGR